MKKLLLCLLILLPSLANAQAEQAYNYKKDIEEFVEKEMKEWAKRDIVITTVEAENEKHQDLSDTDIKILDNKWRGEIRKNKRPLIDRIMSGELSQFIKTIEEQGEGVYTEIIVMDNRGLHVGQSIMSPDYWSGDQDKWTKTFGNRSYATLVEDLKFDDNTELFQVDVSFLLVHNEIPIGAVYAGINVEQLEDWKKRQAE